MIKKNNILKGQSSWYLYFCSLIFIQNVLFYVYPSPNWILKKKILNSTFIKKNIGSFLKYGPTITVLIKINFVSPYLLDRKEDFNVIKEWFRLLLFPNYEIFTQLFLLYNYLLFSYSFYLLTLGGFSNFWKRDIVTQNCN